MELVRSLSRIKTVLGVFNEIINIIIPKNQIAPIGWILKITILRESRRHAEIVKVYDSMILHDELLSEA